jgi:hypothetical protein
MSHLAVATKIRRLSDFFDNIGPQQTSAVSSGYRQRSEFVAPHGDDVTNFK